MGALSWLRGGNDHALAKEHAGESANERNARKAKAKSTARAHRHRNGGATRAARKGQAHEDADRQAEQYGRFGRRR